jgi:hypothetical protein
MSTFLDSLWQALRRTDTTRTQAESLAASDELALVDENNAAQDEDYATFTDTDTDTADDTDGDRDGAEDGDPDSYHQQQSARAVRNGTWMWRPEYKHLAREDDADEL